MRRLRSIVGSLRGMTALAAAAGFSLVDLLLLAALGWLDLSHGPLALTWLILLAARLLLVLGVGGLLVLWKRLRRRAPTQRGLAVSHLAAQLLVLALVVWGFWIEPFQPTVTTLDFSTPGGQPALRIVQLTDFHIESLTGRERAVVEQVRKLQPDLIVLTGDYLNTQFPDPANPKAHEALRWMLSQLQAPLGIYAVNGSVEGFAALPVLFAGLDHITILHEEIRKISAEGRPDLYLVGLSHTYHDEGIKLRRLMSTVPAGARSLVITHTPDVIYDAAAAGVSLYLGGHTHGGQVRLPFYGALVTHSIFGKRFEMGLYTVGSTRMYISRGLGLRGKRAPRARFLCPPEIVLVKW